MIEYGVLGITLGKPTMPSNKKIKWLIYTVVVGLIPFIARIIIFIVSTNRDWQHLINALDLVAFGLVLHISNINELEHVKEDKNWKTIQNGISILFITFFSLLYAVSLIAETNPGIFDIWAIKIAAILLSVSSFILSYSVYDRLSKNTNRR